MLQNEREGDDSRSYPCTQPNILTFQIGGKMFPIDPKDLGNQLPKSKVVPHCSAGMRTDGMRVRLTGQECTFLGGVRRVARSSSRTRTLSPPFDLYVLL